MPVQRRSIDIGSVLGTSVPQSSETSSLPPPPKGRPVDEDDSVIKGNEAWAQGGQVADVVEKALLLPRDMRICAKAGLMTAEGQVVVLKAKLDREYKTSSQLRVEDGELKDAVNVARERAQKAEEEAQAYYDQGFDEAAASLRHQPFRVNSPEEREGREGTEGLMDLESHEALRAPEAAEDLGDPKADDQAPVVEIQEGEDGSDGEGPLDVVD
uniref:Uncharacterized protein n=1 Tax=Fagus sylvatica TaxID=28930 RepID=A0A2N9HHJ6_FAGSY